MKKFIDILENLDVSQLNKIKKVFLKNIFKIEPGTNVIIKDDLSLKKK